MSHSRGVHVAPLACVMRPPLCRTARSRAARTLVRVLASVLVVTRVGYPGALSAQGTASPAAPQAAPSLGLTAALDQARRSGPLARLADARRDVGMGRSRELAQWPNPTVEWRRENLGAPIAPDIFATVYVPVDVTGRRGALRDAATFARARVDADATHDRHDADVQVAQAWLQAAVADGVQHSAEALTAAMREVADVDAARLREGLVSEAVGLRTALEADRARLAVVRAASDAAQARARLARLLGVDMRALPALSTLSAPTLPTPPDSSVAIAMALQRRADLRAREAAVAEAERRRVAEQRGILSDLQLQGGTKETGGFLTGQLGVAVPMPLLNRNGGARQRATGEAIEARVLRDDLRSAIAGHITAAWLGYIAARDASGHVAPLDVRGTDIARIARVAYREGHISLTELLDAERAASDAVRAHLQWMADAWLARLDLERAMGARLDADSPLDLPVATPPVSGTAR